MRLRTINAPSMAQAMELVRREFGDDAIIVSTEENDTGIKVVVALEEIEAEAPDFGAVEGDSFGMEGGRDPVDAVHEALLLHGLPNQLLERLVDASFIVGADEPKEALIGALRQVFDFYPLSERRFNQPVILMGAPGAGKTVTVAKLAARAVFSQRKVRVITTDTVRAGGIEQLGGLVAEGIGLGDRAQVISERDCPGPATEALPPPPPPPSNCGLRKPAARSRLAS